MGQFYTVEFENVTVTAAGGDADLFEIRPIANRPLKVWALFLKVTSELQEVEEEWVRFKIIRGHTTSGNGSATTPQLLDPRSAVAGFSAEIYGTTIASVGTPVDLHSDAFNVRAGLELILPPEMRWKVDTGQTSLVVRMMSTPNDDMSMNGTLYVEEG